MANGLKMINKTIYKKIGKWLYLLKRKSATHTWEWGGGGAGGGGVGGGYCPPPPRPDSDPPPHQFPENFACGEQFYVFFAKKSRLRRAEMSEISFIFKKISPAASFFSAFFRKKFSAPKTRITIPLRPKIEN